MTAPESTPDSLATETVTLVNRVVINAPIEKVWETLTRRDEVLPFFFGTVMKTTELRPGAPVRMRSPNDKYTGVVGDILEFEPPNRFVMTFKFTNYSDPVCKVIHELKEIEGGTEYTLTSAEVPANTKTAKQMAGGGKIIVSCLKSMCEKGKPTMMARFIMVMSSLFAFANPKISRSENWPMDMTIE